MFESSRAEIIPNEQLIDTAGKNVLEKNPGKEDLIGDLTVILKAFGRPIENLPESELN